MDGRTESRTVDSPRSLLCNTKKACVRGSTDGTSGKLASFMALVKSAVMPLEEPRTQPVLLFKVTDT